MYGVNEIRCMNDATRKAKQARKKLWIAGEKTVIGDLKNIPNFGDYRPKGFEETDILFVDSSGFGQPGESALTISQFIDKIKPGYGYAIVDVGQFQIHIAEFKKC